MAHAESGAASHKASAQQTHTYEKTQHTRSMECQHICISIDLDVVDGAGASSSRSPKYRPHYSSVPAQPAMHTLMHDQHAVR